MMGSARQPFFPILICIFALAGGDPALAQLFGLSEEQEIEIGRQAAEEVEKTQPILKNRTINAYVNKLGQWLVKHSERRDLDYHFKVVDDSAINAFALPGGYIYLNRGLLEAADNEAEVAGVLGHEIGHVVGKHGVEQVKKAQLAGLGLGVLGAILGQGRGGQIAGLGAQLFTAGVFSKFSRGAEREADQLGARNLYEAGFEPRAMVTFFQKLDAQRQRDPNALETFFSTHPNPADRADNVSEMIEAFPPREKSRTNSNEFIRAKRLLGRLPAPPAPPAEGDRPSRSEEEERAGDDSGGHRTNPPGQSESSPQPLGYPGWETDRGIAARFAPTFRIQVDSTRGYDFPTTFDFDGDWDLRNNPRNMMLGKDPIVPAVYFALSETESHYFVHYVLYYPYSGPAGDSRGALQQGGDVSACLTVLEKEPGGSWKDARTVFLEAPQGDRLIKYVPNASMRGAFERLWMEEGRPLLSVHPESHDLSAVPSLHSSGNRHERSVVYRYNGRNTSVPRRVSSSSSQVGYRLLALQPLWMAARRVDRSMYAKAFDFGRWTLNVADSRGTMQRRFEIGRAGVALQGESDNASKTLMPWGWLASSQESRGMWFLNPARSVQMHLNLSAEFSDTYLRHPFFEVGLVPARR